MNRVCVGCFARHHERCNGWTRKYEDRGDGVLRLIPCECTSAKHQTSDERLEAK